MTRARELAKLGQNDVWTIDTTNTRVGIGSTIPSSSLNVGIAITMDGPSGVITATSFVGDGSGLDGVASAGFIASLNCAILPSFLALNSISFIA